MPRAKEPGFIAGEVITAQVTKCDSLMCRLQVVQLSPTSLAPGGRERFSAMNLLSSVSLVHLDPPTYSAAQDWISHQRCLSVEDCRPTGPTPADSRGLAFTYAASMFLRTLVVALLETRQVRPSLSPTKTTSVLWSYP